MGKRKSSGFPNRSQLISNTFLALKECGDSATNDEIYEQVIRLMDLPDSIVDTMCADGVETKLQYELRWARTYLKKYGALQNSKRGIWSITKEFSNLSNIDGSLVESTVCFC
jgi:restriction system protein